ncbi:MAG: hypothetical protein LBU73_00905 [Helicobacteraceae bacterium]|nr:hypothetical protein [Helicobacteraceae bacterium]
MNRAQKAFLRGELPIINGVLTRRKYTQIAAIDEDDALLIRKNEPLPKTHCAKIAISHDADYGDYTIYCGEGAYKADGFIAVFDDTKLVWLMFCEFINPIEDAWFVVGKGGEKIVCRNSLGAEYDFDFDLDEEGE